MCACMETDPAVAVPLYASLQSDGAQIHQIKRFAFFGLMLLLFFALGVWVLELARMEGKVDQHVGLYVVDGLPSYLVYLFRFVFWRNSNLASNKLNLFVNWFPLCKHVNCKVWKYESLLV